MSGGRELGGYRLLDEPGGGDADELLRAHDPGQDRDVALRVLAPMPGRRERFLREMPVVARLSEPHLLPVLRYGEADGRLFVAVPLVEGEHLGSVLARTGPLDPGRAVDLAGQVARALDAAAAAGLVHRDVGPSSVLLAARPDGGHPAAGADVVLLADLGVAPVAGRPPAHPAPELAAGSAVDARADVYSLAGLLYELLTGSRPPSADPPPPSAVRPGVPPELDGVVLRGLATDRDQRWTSAGGMAAAARAVLAASGVEVARPPDGLVTPPAAPDGPVGGVRSTAGHTALAVGGTVLLAVLGSAALRRWRRPAA